MVNFSIDKIINKEIINKEIINNKHQTTTLTYLLIGLITIWLTLYAVPGLLASLFNTILGNIILLVGIILVGIKDSKIAIALIILFIVLFKFFYYVTKKSENFASGPYRLHLNGIPVHLIK